MDWLIGDCFSAGLLKFWLPRLTLSLTMVGSGIFFFGGDLYLSIAPALFAFLDCLVRLSFLPSGSIKADLERGFSSFVRRVVGGLSFDCLMGEWL